ncbi:Ribosome quality control complex subunit 1 [Lecanosticta acicola]|uniref:Ribosome quality control complex subunit 1 n=1 Tax=Lecanosticta acicola TaxID=111012 RepID=A0AAI9EF66_9PEZI|nr:Ribosome quality control complex subunit 1 [Lecanosticta acicola]
MSSRALRKAQREKEEQERLKQLQEDARALEGDESEEELSLRSAKKSAFAMLQEQEDGDVEEPADEDHSTPNEEPLEPAAPKASSKKKKKKKKAKAATTEAVEKTEELDEIDAALKQLSTNGNGSSSATTAAGVDSHVDEASRLLAVDSNHLHAQNEMRRLFGRAALQQDDEEQQPPPEALGGNRRQQRRVQQVGLAQALRGQRQGGRTGLAAMALRRNIFIQGKEEWPNATGGGLGMEVEEKRADGTVLYRFVHNMAYQDVQSQFETCVASMDPNRLVALCQMNPYHISTLLQVSEIAKQERNHTTSGDLLERALFSFGRAVHSTFSRNLAEGKARLDFRRAENREFWLASWRYMQNLTMRATWRTVYEWAKLLLSLSPEEDPYAMWLVLDQYALRSRQDLDFLNLSRNATLKEVHRAMPNVQLSQGLAEYRAGNKGKGKQALFTSIGRFPWVIARLMQELNLDPPPAIWGKEPRSSKEKLYAELYATRAKDLWNTPENTSLLIEIASALPSDTPAAAIDADEVTRNEARHVLLSDTPALIALIPRKFTQQMDSASDPLPPEDAYPADVQRQSGNARASGGIAGLQQVEESVREFQSLHQFFAELFPWFRSPAQPARNEDEETDGAGDQRERPPADHETLMQQVEEAGVSRQEFDQRTQRLIQLQDQLFGAGGVGTELLNRYGLAPEDGSDDMPELEQRPNQARVEDAADED